MKAIMFVTYQNDRFDYLKIETTETFYVVERTGTGGVRTDAIFVEEGESVAHILRYDTHEKEPSAHMEQASISEAKASPRLYLHAAETLKMLTQMEIGMDTLNCDMSKIAHYITGLSIDFSSCRTVKDALFVLLNVLGDTHVGTVFERAGALGLIRSATSLTETWFGETTKPLAPIGLCAELIDEQTPLRPGEAAGILFNLFSVKKCGVTFANLLAENDDSFTKKIFDSRERRLVYPYYERFGFHVRENIYHDKNGKEIPSFYLPGGNLNHAYINELTTSDNENYVLCAGWDCHIRKSGRGVPVIYNRITKQTKTLHNQMNVRCYGMLVSRKNVIFFVAGSQIFTYDLKTETKSIVYSEPDGHELQEIPTLTDDGRYLLFFYGTQINYWPNRACLLDLKKGTCKVVLDADWVNMHFGGTKNPFPGHFIISPQNHQIIHFLHAGPDNVDDRIWMFDLATQKFWQPYHQKHLPDGRFAESLTHFIWSGDGEKLYFTRVAEAESELKNGICYILPFQEKHDAVYIDDGYRYIHAVPDSEDRFFIADTHESVADGWQSEIVLIDMKLKYRKKLFCVAITKNHPGHPHPQFSSDGTEILFTFLPDAALPLCVGHVRR